MKDTGGEGCTKKQVALVDVAKELQRIRVRGILSEDRSRLQDKLVGAKVVTLKEHKLIFVRQIQRPNIIFENAEMKSFDSFGAGVGAAVARRYEFCAAEADLFLEY